MKLPSGFVRAPSPRGVGDGVSSAEVSDASLGAPSDGSRELLRTTRRRSGTDATVHGAPQMVMQFHPLDPTIVGAKSEPSPIQIRTNVAEKSEPSLGDVVQADGNGCAWCGGPRPYPLSSYCSTKCRQAAWRVRRLARIEGADGKPRRLAYGDPPYMGLARRYYGKEETFDGEVDHAALIAQLCTFDGWALSCSAKSLRVILPMCPPEAQVAIWTKPLGVPPKTRGAHNRYEPLIYVPARRRQPGVCDHISAQPARFNGTLVGRKPIKVIMWMFELIGAEPGDSLADLFPGTGIVTQCFEQLSRLEPHRDPSRRTSATSSAPGCDEAGDV